ncbi:MAG: cupin domain-containing protein [Victivallaceae bacterium]|nr:cupin domain-containing protein [Victivallaceae bacterium]
MIDSRNGCKNGFCLGISYRTDTDYAQPDEHKDQEGFYVLPGTGMAQVGNEEFPLKPGVSFIVPDSVSHSIKKDPDSVPLKLLYAHGAIS